MCVGVCVCVCVRARERACVRACVCVCVLTLFLKRYILCNSRGGSSVDPPILTLISLHGPQVRCAWWMAPTCTRDVPRSSTTASGSVSVRPSWTARFLKSSAHSWASHRKMLCSLVKSYTNNNNDDSNTFHIVLTL